MKWIIAGSRKFGDPAYVWRCLDFYYKQGSIDEIVSGMADGPDIYGWAYAKGKNIPVKEFPVVQADWDLYGKKAGHLRNEKMADYADIAIIFWDGLSPGSNNMIANMKRRKKPYYLYLVNKKQEEFLS